MSQGEAQSLLDSPLLTQILDELEHDACETGINAAPSDDELRRTSMSDVRALRSLRGKLQTIANGAVTPAKRGSVA